MYRIDRIRNNSLFRECLLGTAECEKNRIFCGHGWEHLLNTARIAYILSLEEGLNIDKEYIYAAALLHDIGRLRQYTDGIPHETAGAEIGAEILSECGFTKEESDLIIGAIISHRDAKAWRTGLLAGVLYRADKLSRECWDCSAKQQCNWSDEKKNLTLTV